MSSSFTAAFSPITATSSASSSPSGDDRAREFIDRELVEQARLWPEPLLQVSPSSARIASVDELATPEDIRCILGPADVHGPDFPGETFRVLKEKETAKFGEYRTRRLVLEAWGKQERENVRRVGAENVRA